MSLLVRSRLGTKQRYYILAYSRGAAFALALSGLVPQCQLFGVGLVAPVAPWPIASQYMDPQALSRISRVTAHPSVHWFATQATLGLLAQYASPQVWTSFMDLFEYFDARQPHQAASAPSRREYKLTKEREKWSRPNGIIQDVIDMQRDWGFDWTTEVTRKRIIVWYGSKDNTVPRQPCQYLCERLPNAELRKLTGAQHRAVLRSFATSILSQLTSHTVPNDASY